MNAALNSRRVGALAAAGVLGAVVAMTIATGASQAQTLSVIGNMGAKPSCPDRCLVEARVTGFQATIGKRNKPYKVPVDGRIVAWTVKLGKPRGRDINFFNKRFKRSKAKLAVLKSYRVKRGPKKGKVKYKLKRQSPVQRLRPFFGTTTTFRLQQPLTVRRGWVVALTIPTWAPVFSVEAGKRTRWKASRAATRKRGPCTTRRGFANLKAGKQHGKLKSSRRYACVYRNARLLYSATLASP